MFTWSGTPPSPAAFQAAVEQAFAAWTTVDPESGLPATFSFVADFGTTVVFDPPADPTMGVDYIGANLGAEIDLIATNDGLDYDPGDPSLRGNTYFFIDGAAINNLTLTSGKTSHPGGAIGGADILMNDDPSAEWTLDWFQLILTHEIGHALGLSDVDVFPGLSGINSAYYDDNYDGSSSATALATLTNSFAALVTPLNPEASPGLSGFVVPDADPGLDTAGVDILMETVIPSVFLGVDEPLQNDDYAARQFMYPFSVQTINVPALGPFGLGVLVLLTAGLGVLGLRFRQAV